ncbi:MAG: hypothetical protein H6670_07910 [Anaerolineaceae bacterium]|nr:hypothetical protein [Anaerolineaceae bacterium]
MTSLLTAFDEHCRILMIDPQCGRCRLIMNQFLVDVNKTVYLDCNLFGDPETLQAALENVYPEQASDFSLGAYEYIILDQVDCMQTDRLARFLRSALSELAEKALIVLFGRSMPYELLFDNELEKLIQIYPPLHGITSAQPQPPDSKYFGQGGGNVHRHHRLVVRGFSGGRVWLDGQLVEEWGGILPRNLFFYMIDRGIAHRDDIFKVFWPDLPTKEATNVFHVTKRKIHEHLNDLEVIRYSSGFYTIADDISIYYDVRAFQKLIQAADIAEGQERIELMQEAIDVANNRFLDTIDQSWIAVRRVELMEQLTDLLIELAKARNVVGEKDHALGLFVRALSMNLAREDVAMEIMKLYLSRHQPASALNVYHRIEEHLQASFGIQPQKSLRDLRDEAQSMLDADEEDEDDRS